MPIDYYLLNEPKDHKKKNFLKLLSEKRNWLKDGGLLIVLLCNISLNSEVGMNSFPFHFINAVGCTCIVQYL